MFPKCFSLIFASLTLSLQPLIAQKESAQDRSIPKTDPLFSGLHTLSIHVRDTITHDSVFHFLADELNLPVYYYPLTMGKRKYAGLYAGNLVLEPCGPYSNFFYASDDFRAIFFGLTFEPYKSIFHTANALLERKISFEAGDNYVYLKDSLLCGENITISFMDKGDERTGDIRKKDSLRHELTTRSKNELGIEYIKEIQIGYKDNAGLERWKKFLSPNEMAYNEIGMLSNLLEIHFVNSNIKEVQSITFKVRSLEKARQYLEKNNLFGRITADKIQLNTFRTFGLSIFISE